MGLFGEDDVDMSKQRDNEEEEAVSDSSDSSNEEEEEGSQVGVRTRAQRQRDLDGVGGGRKLKREIRDLQEGMRQVMGGKEVGDGARSLGLDDRELWEYYNDLDGTFWRRWCGQEDPCYDHLWGFNNVIEERDLDREYFDDESFWGNWEGDRSVGEEAEKLELSYEHAGYSAVESDYKEPRTYREMMRRPENEREK